MLEFEKLNKLDYTYKISLLMSVITISLSYSIYLITSNLLAFILTFLYFGFLYLTLTILTKQEITKIKKDLKKKIKDDNNVIRNTRRFRKRKNTTAN